MDVIIFKCKMCGGSIDIGQSDGVGTCEYCGTRQTFPKYMDEERVQLYRRAGDYRMENNYDKANGVYREILHKHDKDAEAYWSLVLCRYGIEYVADPRSGRRVPTVNRAQFVSIFDDEDYKAAIQYADPMQRSVMQDEARVIDGIQKRILAISRGEKPFDIFICYKETDESGKRTRDSVIANDLYHLLTKQGYKVFFSRITLENKLGMEYEPYIFAALHSAKAMIVIGTDPRYFEAVWVRNEWERYLNLIRNGENKVLIPAYRDMDPYDLPEEFSRLQALDMSQLGFMQDLLHGLNKIIGVAPSPPYPVPTPVPTPTPMPTPTPAPRPLSFFGGNSAQNTEDLLAQAQKMISAKDFIAASPKCNQVLYRDPTNVTAHLYRVLCTFKITDVEQLSELNDFYEYNAFYKELYKYADEELRQKLDYILHKHTAYITPIMDKLLDTYRRPILLVLIDILLLICAALIASNANNTADASVAIGILWTAVCAYKCLIARSDMKNKYRMAQIRLGGLFLGSNVVLCIMSLLFLITGIAGEDILIFMLGFGLIPLIILIMELVAGILILLVSILTLEKELRNRCFRGIGRLMWQDIFTAFKR